MPAQQGSSGAVGSHAALDARQAPAVPVEALAEAVLALDAACDAVPPPSPDAPPAPLDELLPHPSEVPKIEASARTRANFIMRPS